MKKFTIGFYGRNICAGYKQLIRLPAQRSRKCLQDWLQLSPKNYIIVNKGKIVAKLVNLSIGLNFLRNDKNFFWCRGILNNSQCNSICCSEVYIQDLI